MANYDIFRNEELKIADRVQKLRLCLLVHSCIYYHLNNNIISDKQWDEWAKELVNMQKSYPDISAKVCWHDAFKDWDASTGAFLPITDKWVVMKAKQLLGCRYKEKTEQKPAQIKKKSAVSKKKSLF